MSDFSGWWLVEKGKGQKSNLVSPGCSRAATKKGKTRNDIIWEPEVITVTTSDVIPESEMKIHHDNRNRKWKNPHDNQKWN